MALAYDPPALEMGPLESPSELEVKERHLWRVPDLVEVTSVEIEVTPENLFKEWIKARHHAEEDETVELESWDAENLRILDIKNPKVELIGFMYVNYVLRWSRPIEVGPFSRHKYEKNGVPYQVHATYEPLGIDKKHEHELDERVITLFGARAESRPLKESLTAKDYLSTKLSRLGVRYLL